MSFPLIGNDRVRRNITSMIKNNKIPHAIILEGEEGLGKKTLAEFIAQAFLCGNNNKPCNTCKSCHLVKVGSHPDLNITVPEGAEIKVDQIRALRNEAYLAPMMCDGRVFIIQSAELMNTNSQNALLKILEEPPQKVCFILLCKNASSLLPTVRSRCVCFTLSPVLLENEGFERVAQLLKNSSKDPKSLLVAADGNIGKAITLGSEEGTILSKIAGEIMLQASENNKFKILQILQPFAKQRKDVAVIISELKNAVSKEMQKKAVEEYSSFTYEKLIGIYDKLTNVEKTLEFNPSMGLVFCIISDCLTK